MISTSIDDIYEAAFEPERWTNVLESLGRLSNSASTAILIFGDGMPPRGIASNSVAEIFDTFLHSVDWTASVRIRRMLSLKPTGFVLVDSFVSPEESETDPAWSLLRAQGRASQLCTMIPMPSGETVTFTAERDSGAGSYRAEDIAALDALRPHLARAGMVSARLSMERAREAVATIEQLGLAAAVLTGGGRVCAANALFEGLSAAILPSAFGKVVLADHRPNALFQSALERLHAAGAGGIQSIPVTATAEHGALVVHLLPLRGVARDLFGAADVLMIVTAAVAASVPSVAVLNGLFDLSPAEARLARHLARGTTVNEVASATGVSVATLRTQLSAVFAKTATTRQTELLTLLAGIWMPPDHGASG